MNHRILHIIDPANQTVGPCVCRLVADAVPTTTTRDSEVLVLGSTTAQHTARSAGLNTPDRINTIADRPYLSIPAFRRFVRRTGPIDLIHAWSLSTLTLAILAQPNTPRVLYLSGNPQTQKSAKWLRTLINGAWHRRIQISSNQPPAKPIRTQLLAMSQSVKRAWVEAGGINPQHITILRPGLNFAVIRSDNRAPLRARWGVHSDDELVIAPLVHPPHCLDAKRMIAILILLGLSGMKTTMILPPGANGLSTAYRLLESAKVSVRLIVDELINQPWQALPAVDAVLITGDDTKTAVGVSGTLPMLWAAAAGRTIIAEAGYGSSEIIEHNHSAYLTKPRDDRALVTRIRESVSNTTQTIKMRDAARSEAFSLFSRSRFAENLTLAHRQILTNDDVSIPDIPLTGGLRFAGKF